MQQWHTMTDPIVKQYIIFMSCETYSILQWR